MERKYAFIKNRYKYDEECIQFLEDMSYDGWKLHHIGLLFFSFVSCSKHLKYQIDYTDIDEEYNEVIESLGYTYITHWNFRNIYVSENKNAVDLQTDNEVYKQSLLQFYTRNSKLCFIILGIILLLIAGVIAYSIFTTPYSFYRSFNEMLISITIFLLSIYFFVYSYTIHLKRKSIINNTYTYNKFKFYDMISEFYPFITIFTLIISSNMFEFFMSLIIPIILFLTTHLQESIINRQISKKKRKYLKYSFAFVFVILYFGFIYFVDNNQIELPRYNNIPFSTSYPQYDSIYECDKNFFSSYVRSFGDNPSEVNYYQCRNKDVSDQIFKYLIIESEINTRIPTEEEIDIIVNKTGSWSSDDIERYSYEKALSFYKEYKSSYFKKCYYIDDIVVAMDDHVVISIIGISKKDFDHVLKQYKNFTEQNYIY